MKYFILFIFSFSTLHLYAQHKDIPVTAEFVITGAVNKEITFRIADIAAMKQDVIGDVVLHGHKTDTAKQMKGVSSAMLNDHSDAMQDRFAWQDGYACFSISRPHLRVAIAYVKNQKKHHACGVVWTGWEETNTPVGSTTRVDHTGDVI